MMRQLVMVIAALAPLRQAGDHATATLARVRPVPRLTAPPSLRRHTPRASGEPSLYCGRSYFEAFRLRLGEACMVRLGLRRLAGFGACASSKATSRRSLSRAAARLFLMSISRPIT